MPENQNVEATQSYPDPVPQAGQHLPAPHHAPVPQQHGAAAPGQFYGAQPAVAPKNPIVALIASFFVAGLGTMLNGQVAKGIGILIGYAVGWMFSFILIGIPFLFGFWIWGMVDAYTGARKWNARHGIVG